MNSAFRKFRTRFHAELDLPKLPSWFLARREPLDSTPAAFFRFHLRRIAFWLPVTTAFLWTLVALRYIRVPMPAAHINETHPWARLLDLCPFSCLCVASLLCGLRFSDIPLIGRDRKDKALLCISGTAESAARARLLADAIALCATLCMISIPHLIWLFSADDRLLFKMASAGLSAGYTSLREVLSWAIGVPLIALAIAWVCIGVSYRVIRRFALLVPLTTLVLGILRDRIPDAQRFLQEDELILRVFPGMVIAFAVLIGLLTLRRNRMSLGAISRSCTLWCGFAFVSYPFEPFIAQGQWFNGDSLLIVAAVGAAITAPCYAAVLDIIRRRKRVLKDQGAALSGSTPLTASRWALRTSYAILLAFALFIAWIRWPAEPAVCALWRSQGLPSTPQELKVLYPAVNDEENLALKCLESRDRYVKRFQEWPHDRSERTQAFWFEHDRIPWRPVDDLPFEVCEHLLIVGYAGAERDEPILQETLRVSREFWDYVGRDTAEELHRLVDCGLTKSRYPIDFSQGLEMSLRHLARVRDLTRVLQVEATLAAVDGNTAQVADASLTAIRIANSLESEPLIISQIVRTTLLSASAKTLEVAIGRTDLCSSEIQELQESFAAALQPAWVGHISDRGVRSEEVMFAYGLRNPIRVREAIAEALGSSMEGGPSLAVALDILGLDNLTRLAYVWTVSRVLAWARETCLTGYIDLAKLEKAGWPFEHALECLCDVQISPFGKPIHSDLSWRLDLSNEILPSIERIYKDEWRRRTELNCALVALAAERFRLARGILPKSLDELVPEYIDCIPQDPWNPGHRLSYKIKENGDFVVYSFGYDRRDNDGKEYARGEGMLSTDITFTVGSQKIRDDTD